MSDVLSLIDDPLRLTAAISMLLLFCGVLCASIRLVRGPSLADRVVALDFVAVVLIAVTSLLAILTDEVAFLDLAVVFALTAFLATVAFARYAERRNRRPRAVPVAADVEGRAEDRLNGSGGRP